VVSRHRAQGADQPWPENPKARANEPKPPRVTLEFESDVAADDD